MVDGGTYNGDKAYKDSKLCNILFTRELQRRLESSEATKNIVVNSFSPGLITSSGFFRYQSPLFSKVGSLLIHGRCSPFNNSFFLTRISSKRLLASLPKRLREWQKRLSGEEGAWSIWSPTSTRELSSGTANQALQSMATLPMASSSLFQISALRPRTTRRRRSYGNSAKSWLAFHPDLPDYENTLHWGSTCCHWQQDVKCELIVFKF